MRRSAPAKREPRAHHFVPKFWLAGFTDTGENDGRLWVTDLKRRKQWLSNPENTGHRRDFYRVSDEEVRDPLTFEKLFSRIEGTFAPLLKEINKRPRGPFRDEWESLFKYIAIQWMRVPAFRPTLLRITDEIQQRFMAKVLKTPRTWAEFLKKVGVPADTPGAEYNKMLEFERGHHYELSAEPEFFLYRGFKAIEGVASTLAERHWGAAISVPGGFIGSDNPVIMDGPKGQQIGFKSAEVVIFAASRHVFLYGANCSIKPLPVTYKRAAAQNTFTMLTSHEQVYSPVPDFYWLDENGKYQTNWRLFSKDKIIESAVVGIPMFASDDS